jgi:hypothetical protein
VPDVQASVGELLGGGAAQEPDGGRHITTRAVIDAAVRHADHLGGTRTVHEGGAVGDAVALNGAVAVDGPGHAVERGVQEDVLVLIQTELLDAVGIRRHGPHGEALDVEDLEALEVLEVVHAEVVADVRGRVVVHAVRVTGVAPGVAIPVALEHVPGVDAVVVGVGHRIHVAVGVVRAAIAVVIEAVAAEVERVAHRDDLADALHALEGAVRAGLRAADTGADVLGPFGTGVAPLGQRETHTVFVHGVVAVVVEAIADLERTLDHGRGGADCHAGGAHDVALAPALAEEAIVAGHAHAEALVDVAIAVVVHAIADLDAGRVAVRHRIAGVAERVAVGVVLVLVGDERAVVEHVGRAVAIAVGQREGVAVDLLLVHGAIAVVVDAVTDLVRAGIDEGVVLAAVHVAEEAITVEIERGAAAILDRDVVAGLEVGDAVGVAVRVAGVAERVAALPLAVGVHLVGVPRAGAVVALVQHAVRVVVGIAGVAERVAVAVAAVEVGLVEVVHHRTIVHDVRHVVAVRIGIAGVAEAVAIEIGLVGVRDTRTVVQVVGKAVEVLVIVDAERLVGVGAGRHGAADEIGAEGQQAHEQNVERAHVRFSIIKASFTLHQFHLSAESILSFIL